VRAQLREWRERRSLTQQELARLAGVSRQTVGGIEAGRYGPGVEVGLRLARALGCRVEDLFGLDDDAVPAPVPDGTRVALSEVGGRTVVRALDGLGGVRWHAAAGCGVAAGGRVEPWAGAQPGLFLVGCDPALGLLAVHCRVPAYWWQAGNAAAMAQLQRGEVHAACVHGPADATAAGYVRVRLARWQMGWIMRKGNPKGFAGAADLPRVRLASREPGSGARVLLDDLGAGPGVRVCQSHAEVAEAIALGLADVGVAPAVAAGEYGLDFQPLREESCDLLVRPGEPMAAALLDAVRSGRFAADLGAFGPYDTAKTGDEIAS
jgi:putative molybdopterin biosynthesis protein